MSNEIQFLLYNMPDDAGKVQVVVKEETIWCTQKAMSQLFGVGVPAISKHLSHIFEEGELDKKMVVSKMEITTQHGAIEDKTQTEEVDFYNLDAKIAVGYPSYRTGNKKIRASSNWIFRLCGRFNRKRKHFQYESICQ